LKKRLTTILKIAVPVAIIGYLVYSVLTHRPDSPDQAGTFEQVGSAAWNWGSLAAAFFLILLAIVITFCRWYLLVRALGLKFRLRDAFRLGFLGFLLNFVGAGSVGGDLFKAVFIAHEQPGRRTEAVATVVVDRVIGLYALLIVATLTLLLAGIENQKIEFLTIERLTYIFTAVGGIAVILVLVPGFTSGKVSDWLGSLPKVGPTLGRLIVAIRMYRERKWVLVSAGALSLGVHTLLAACTWCLATGLFGQAPGLNAPTLGEHLVITPLSMICAAVPISPAGLGTFELALEALYRMLATEPMQPGQGLIVALGFRATQIGVLVIGAIYYWTSRREVSELIHEAELEQGGASGK
jgi:uncharacterized protein (TIRG00374 family)